MKIQVKINLFMFLMFILLILSIVSVGYVVINKIIYQLNDQLLSRELDHIYEEIVELGHNDDLHGLEQIESHQISSQKELLEHLQTHNLQYFNKHIQLYIINSHYQIILHPDYQTGQPFLFDFVKKMFDCPHLVFTAQKQVATIGFLDQQINDIEAVVSPQIQLNPEFEKQLSIPGIGDILGLTIMSEVGDIKRFAKAGQYSSYCRCVSSERMSNGKKKGQNNRKNGNRYLGWAYVEAANFCIRYCSDAQRFFQRKLAKTKRVVAIKALSNKLAKASYYIIKDQVPFDAKKLFG